MNSEKSGYSIQAENLGKQFTDVEVLKDVNLSVKEGEFIVIVGHSGCGKSTLLRLISALDFPTDGILKVDGQEVRNIDSSVRFLFQDARLLPWKNVLKNVVLGDPSRSVEMAENALGLVGLKERKNVWPKVLSGGQKQRVSLARAIVGKPKVLLLDEPLGALDALTRMEMQNLIEEIWLKRKFTVILVTHDVSEAVRLADRVILMEDKKITMDLKITLPRPRLKDEDANYFEQKILKELLKTDEDNSESRKMEYMI